MFYLFNSNFTHKLIYSTVFITFAVNSVPQIYADEYYSGVNDVWIIMKITNLVEDLKANKKNPNRMINTLVDILNEGKNAYGIRFDLDAAMNQIISQIKAQNLPVPVHRLGNIRDRIQKRMKEVKCQLDYIDVIKDIEGIDFNDSEYLGTIYNCENNSHNIDPDKIPAELVWGVCVSLTGIFLMALPIPVCKTWGATLLALGVGSCANVICKEIDDKDE